MDTHGIQMDIAMGRIVVVKGLWNAILRKTRYNKWELTILHVNKIIPMFSSKCHFLTFGYQLNYISWYCSKPCYSIHLMDNALENAFRMYISSIHIFIFSHPLFYFTVLGTCIFHSLSVSTSWNQIEIECPVVK